RAVQVPVELLAVLAVVPFLPGQPEQPFLEDRVLLVPQGEREAEVLAAIGDAGDPVLVPAVGPGTGVIMGQVVPRGPARAVVLPQRSPRPLAEIGTPAVPVPDALPGLLQAELLRVDGGGAQLRDGGAHRFTSSRTWPSGSRKRIGRVGGERG